MASSTGVDLSLSGLASGLDWQTLISKLAAAERILETESVEDVTARRLCREVGVTSGNFYNHFESLDFLLL